MDVTRCACVGFWRNKTFPTSQGGEMDVAARGRTSHLTTTPCVCVRQLNYYSDCVAGAHHPLDKPPRPLVGEGVGERVQIKLENPTADPNQRFQI
jgi:hypothetical protein